MDTPLDVLYEFDRHWKPPPPSVTDAAVRPLPPPAPEIDADAELDGLMRSQAEVGATIIRIINTWMGDCLREGTPSRYITSHLGQLSLQK